MCWLPRNGLLSFQNPALFRRLNRIVQDCRWAVIRARVADFQNCFGIMSGKVTPAYASQTCWCCGYVDQRNRPSQGAFQWLCCRNKRHADLNAARMPRQTRAPDLVAVELFR